VSIPTPYPTGAVIEWPELRSRVYEALELTQDIVAANRIDDWLLRSATDAVILIDSNRNLWHAISDLEHKEVLTVGENDTVDWPVNALRIRPFGSVHGRTITQVRPAHDVVRQDQYDQPTNGDPFLVPRGQGAGSAIEVWPRQFSDQQLVLYYIAKPTMSTKFGTEIADFIVYGAAKMGALELNNQTKFQICQERYAEKLRLLGLAQA
jgi:hypothetical protein